MRERDDFPAGEERSAEEMSERNIARLLRAADHPAAPSELAIRRWRERMRSELPGVARRARSRRRRASFGPAAAAALLVLGLTASLPFLRERSASFPIVARVAEVELLAAGSDAWQPLGEARLLRPGDAIRLGDGAPAGSLGIELPGGGLFALDRGALRHDGERLFLAGGEGEWSAPERRRGSLATPLLLLKASDAEVRVQVRSADPLPGEGNEMNARKLSAIGGGLAVIVTVIVLSTGDEPVDVERGNERVALQAGDTASAGPGGGVTVTRGGDTATAASVPAPSAPAPAAVPPTSETPAETAREIAVAIVDPTGAPVAGASIAVHGAAEGLDGVGAEGAEGAAGATAPASRSAQTDAEGRAVARVPFEWTSAKVEVSAPRHASISLPWSTPEAGGEEAAGAAAPDAGAAAEPWTITLPFETSIAGRVIDRASGEPVGDALVAIQRDVGAQGWSDPVLQGSLDADGTFYYGPLVPGRYWLWSYKAGSVRTETLTVEVAEGQRAAGLDLSLAPGATVKVSAFEKRTGLPVAGAVAYPHLDHLPGTVDIVHRGEPFDERVRNAARTGGDGVATLEDLPLRKTLLRVLHRGYRPVDVWVEPSAAARDRKSVV